MAASRLRVENYVCPKCLEDPSHSSYHQLAKVNSEINRMDRDDMILQLKSLHIDSGGHIDILKKRLKSYHRSVLLSSHGRRAHFNYLCVIDFEATCQQGIKDFEHEIIEFPAVLVDTKTVSIVDEFQCYCKPVVNPLLTKFCKNLTGISQIDVDSAEHFPEVLRRFELWLEKYKLLSQYSFAIVTDGPYDIARFLKSQCEQSEVDLPKYAESWINIRKSFSNYYKTGRMNLACMLDYLGLSFEGTQHCGLHDSRNVARIVLRMMRDGANLKCNDTLANTSTVLQSASSQKQQGSKKENNKDCVVDISRCNPNDYLGVDPDTIGHEVVLLSHK